MGNIINTHLMSTTNFILESAMKKMMTYFLLLVSTLSSVSAFAGRANDVGRVVAGHTFEWHWEQGAFKGAAFRVSFLHDGRLHWLGIQGGVRGKQNTGKQYQSIALSNNLQMISWLEKSGCTVTIIPNSSEGTCQEIVSSTSEWYPLSGSNRSTNAGKQCMQA